MQYAYYILYIHIEIERGVYTLTEEKLENRRQLERLKDF